MRWSERVGQILMLLQWHNRYHSYWLPPHLPLFKLQVSILLHLLPKDLILFMRVVKSKYTAMWHTASRGSWFYQLLILSICNCLIMAMFVLPLSNFFTTTYQMVIVSSCLPQSRQEGVTSDVASHCICGDNTILCCQNKPFCFRH